MLTLIDCVGCIWLHSCQDAPRGLQPLLLEDRSPKSDACMNHDNTTYRCIHSLTEAIHIVQNIHKTKSGLIPPCVIPPSFDLSKQINRPDHRPASNDRRCALGIHTCQNAPGTTSTEAPNPKTESALFPRMWRPETLSSHAASSREECSFRRCRRRYMAHAAALSCTAPWLATAFTLVAGERGMYIYIYIYILFVYIYIYI